MRVEADQATLGRFFLRAMARHERVSRGSLLSRWHGIQSLMSVGRAGSWMEKYFHFYGRGNLWWDWNSCAYPLFGPISSVCVCVDTLCVCVLMQYCLFLVLGMESVGRNNVIWGNFSVHAVYYCQNHQNHVYVAPCLPTHPPLTTSPFWFVLLIFGGKILWSILWLRGYGNLLYYFCDY